MYERIATVSLGMDQYQQVSEWETQLAGLVARNSASRGPGTTALALRCRHPYPRHPDHRLDTRSTAVISPASTRPEPQSPSSVKEQIKKQANVLDIVRGQLSVFSNEIASQHRALEGMGAEISSQGRLLKSRHTEEKTTKMRLNAAASEITILQRQQKEANDSTANILLQMQRELSELRADVKVLKKENAMMRKQLDNVGVNIAEGNCARSPCSSPTSLNDRIKTIVAAAVTIHSSEMDKATNQSIRDLQSRIYSAIEEQRDVASRDTKELEHRFALAVDDALSEAIVGIREELAPYKDDLQPELKNDVDEGDITTGIINERICKLETRQNLVEEQLYEQTSATLTADSFFLQGNNNSHSLLSMDRVPQVQSTDIHAHDENSSDASTGCLIQQLQSKRQLDDEILQYITTADAPSLTTVGEENDVDSDISVVGGEVRVKNTIQQAPEWLHSAVVEELKMKFLHQND